MFTTWPHGVVMFLSEMTTGKQNLRHEFDRLQSSAQEVCSCVLGSAHSSPGADRVDRYSSLPRASTVLSAVVLRYPELDLVGLEDDLSAGKPYEDVLVVARILEPIASKVARGLTFVAVRRVRRAERELDVSGGSAGAVVDASSTGGPAAPSSIVDPPLQQ